MFRSIFLNFKLFIESIRVIFSLKNKKSISPKEKTAIINGTPVMYFKEGRKGKPLILLHGWGQSKETWTEVIKRLSKNNVVYAPDLPGFGKTSLPGNISNLKDYSDMLEGFINKNKIKKAIFLGHSFGGKIAVQFTLTHREKVSKLIIYSSNILAKKGVFEIVTSLGAGILGTKFLEFPIRIYLYFRTKSYRKFKTLLKIYKEQKTRNFRNNIRKIDIETLLFYGKYDPLCPLSCGEELSKLIPHSKLAVFEKSSHLAHLEEQAKFTRELSEFLR